MRTFAKTDLENMRARLVVGINQAWHALQVKMKLFWKNTEKRNAQKITECEECAANGTECVRTSYKPHNWFEVEAFSCGDKLKKEEENLENPDENKDLDDTETIDKDSGDFVVSL